jgi:hypothetical protein
MSFRLLRFWPLFAIALAACAVGVGTSFGPGVDSHGEHGHLSSLSDAGDGG